MVPRPAVGAMALPCPAVSSGRRLCRAHSPKGAFMEQAPSAATQTPSSSIYPRRAATYLFWLLWFANFINYVDRFALTALLDPISQSFHIENNNTLQGLLGTSFLFVYTITILPVGLLADRIKRKFVIAGGMSVWSLVTALTGLVTNFPALFATRAALGAGEGSYFPPSTSMLASVYPEQRRAQVMSRWNTGLLIGAAVGTTGAGFLLKAFGDWRPVFYFFGIPGLILSLLVLLAKEPPRNAEGEAVNIEAQLARRGLRGIAQEVRGLLRIPTLRITVALQALSFFVYGATTLFLNLLIGDQFFHKLPTNERVASAAAITGPVLILGGVSGLLVGGFLADRLIKRIPGARVLVSGWGLLLAAPIFALAVIAMIADLGLPLNVRLYAIFAPAFFLTVALLQINSGPLTAVSQDVVSPMQRAAAVGVTLLLSHFLGDLFAPFIVGVISDTLRNNFAGQWIITSANTLGLAFLITCVPFLLIAGAIGIHGARAVKPDLDQMRAAMGTVAPALAEE